MSSDDYRLKELDAQIKLKLAEGKIDEAEKLSAKLIEVAEGAQPNNTALMMVSQLFNSVVSRIPSAPSAEQIAQIKEGAVNEEHLRLLSLAHYINGAIVGLFSCFLLIHIGMGVMMIIHPGWFPDSTAHGGPGSAVGWMFSLFGLAGLLFGWTYAGLNVFAGRALRQRKRRMFCLVVSGLNCLNAPIGTVLGVSTYLVLAKPQVKNMFKS